ITQEIIKKKGKHWIRPAIFPVPNPTPFTEARPEDLIKWAEGRALAATGSPLAPVDYKGTRDAIGEANNAFVFPGLG
ncbi:malic enzyme-like NAD(P)-binding protein, partial [Bacillus sp. GbtcB13]|uniref:malic enzyme-like NAD(P)-binding protein n=1 Tax=Bacillus sp. GbtcB13 TaxID=2824758 RepID=UPI002671DBB9